jgi:hypothetical protein
MTATCRIHFLFVRMNASFHSQVSGKAWQMPAMMRSKSDKKRSIVFIGYEAGIVPDNRIGKAWLKLA